MQDTELLRDYLKNGSEAAFSELVKRYVDFVYSTARRQTGDAHLAEEIAQSVFCLLARKAGALNGHATIAAWLYRATCFTAARSVRSEQRRRQREHEAANMNQYDMESGGAWEHLSPMLDQALNELGETDRLAVLLRFFQRKPLREVGHALGVSEDAAKVRVSRAVERLRIIFAKRGAVCSAAALGILLTEKAVEAAPATMASSITAMALSGATVSTYSFLQLLKFMAGIKAQTLAMAGAAALVLLLGGLHVYNTSRGAGETEVDVAGTTAISKSELADAKRSMAGQNSSNLGTGTTSGPVEGEIDLNDAIARLRAALRSTNNAVVPGFEVAEAVERFGRHGQVAFRVLKEEAAAHSETNLPTADAELAPRRAVSGMGFLGKSVPDAVPYLWHAYDASPSKESDSFGYLALAALNQIGFEAQDISRLAQKVLTFTNFHYSDGFVRSQTADWIAKVIKKDPTAARPYISTVEDLLYGPDTKTRFWAACALVEYEGAGNPAIIDTIKSGLKTADKDTLGWASKIIFQDAGAAISAIAPALVDAAKASDDKTAREWAFLAAGSINEGIRKEVAEVDQALKKDEDSKLWLAKINSGTATYEDLAPHLKEKDDAGVTAQLLGNMGAAASNAIPEMIKALNSQDGETTGQIMEAIHKIDSHAAIVQLDAETVEAAVGKLSDDKLKAQATEFFGIENDGAGPGPWWKYYTPEEFARFVNKMAEQNQDACRAFAKVILAKEPGLKEAFKSLPPE